MTVAVTETGLTLRMSTSRGGRPSKGERALLAARAPIPLAEAVRHQAAEAGLNVNDYIVTLLARETHLLEFAPKPADPTRLELPIPAA
jgi:hypothetical protein